jgi:hypothetical protein
LYGAGQTPRVSYRAPECDRRCSGRL